jgi:hypothetical protein
VKELFGDNSPSCSKFSLAAILVRLGIVGSIVAAPRTALVPVETADGKTKDICMAECYIGIPQVNYRLWNSLTSFGWWP